MAQTTLTLRSTEAGDEGPATAFEHPQLVGRAATYAVPLVEAGPNGLRWREHFAPDVRVHVLAQFAAAQITIGGDNMTPLDQRLADGFDCLDRERVFEVIEWSGHSASWLQFDRRPASSDDFGDFRRVTLSPTAAVAMHRLLDVGDSGIHANEIDSRAKRLLAQAGVVISPVDSRWPNSFQRLDPSIEWRAAQPFSDLAAYAPPEPPRERELVIEHDIHFDHGVVKQGRRTFKGDLADAVATLIKAADAGIHFKELPPNVSYLLQAAFVPFEGDEDGTTRLAAPSPWTIVSDSTPKFGAAA